MNDERYRALLRELRTQRKGCGVSQQELARRISKPQSFVSKVEKGRQEMTLLEFIEIAWTLNLDAADLLRAAKLNKLK